MTRALLALLLTGCFMPTGATALDGTWCSGHDVATCCVAYTFGPGDEYEMDDCDGDYIHGTYSTNGDALHIDGGSGRQLDMTWSLGTGVVVRHGQPGYE